MTIFTDKRLRHNRTVITVVGKDTQEWTIMDIAVPADQNVLTNEEEKMEKYQHQALEINRIHRTTRVKVIRIVIGALGTISGNGKAWYGRLRLADIFGSAQLSAMLGTAQIMRKVWCL